MLQRFAKAVIQDEWDKRSMEPLLTLTDEHRRRGWEVLHKIGIPEGAWFVGMHVREGVFKKEGTGTYNSRRNADIDTYAKAIKAVTERGGWVIRLGERDMKPLPPLANTFDYARSEYKSDWMDIFLCGASRFFITTSAGVADTPTLFGVPLVATNYDGPCRHYSSRDIFVFKNVKNRKTSQLLNFFELHQPPVFNGIRGEYFDEMGLDFIDNTPDELRQATEEMLDRCEGKLIYSAEDEALQEGFRKLFPAELGKATLRVGRDFLRKYADLLAR